MSNEVEEQQPEFQQPEPSAMAEATPHAHPVARSLRPVAFYQRRWVKVAAVSFGAFILLIILLDNVIMPLYVKRGSVATVPQVVGMKKDDAKKKLSDAGYEPVEYEVRFDEKGIEGTIVRQTPEGGEETKPGRKIYLIISGGKEMAVVPDLRGRSLRDAKMMLLKANMTVGNIAYGYTDSAGNGTVFQQTPPPGSKTSASTQVSVVVSQGPLVGRVPVPDVKKLTLAQAIEKLKSVKLELGKVTYQNGSPESSVLDQYPQPGELVNEGATIDVFVARGGEGAPPEH